MKIRYHKLGLLFEMQSGETVSLVLESPEACEQFLIDYDAYIEKIAEDMAFFSDEKELKFQKECVLITNPLDLHYHSREMQKKLYTELEELAFERELLTHMTELHGQQLAMLERLSLASDEALAFQEVFDFTELMKLFRVELKNPEGRFAEKLIDYITTMHRLLGKTFFLLANCDVYLREEDYRHLQQLAHHRELYLLFLQHRPSPLQHEIRAIIIDEEMCEIH